MQPVEEVDEVDDRRKIRQRKNIKLIARVCLLIGTISLLVYAVFFKDIDKDTLEKIITLLFKLIRLSGGVSISPIKSHDGESFQTPENNTQENIL